jgi:hypothetical protein
VVFIRDRNPWERLRLMLLGWYVRFMTSLRWAAFSKLSDELGIYPQGH